MNESNDPIGKAVPYDQSLGKGGTVQGSLLNRRIPEHTVHRGRRLRDGKSKERKGTENESRD